MEVRELIEEIVKALVDNRPGPVCRDSGDAVVRSRATRRPW